MLKKKFKKNQNCRIIKKYKRTKPAEEIYPRTNMKMIRPKINYFRAIISIVLTLATVALFTYAIIFALSKFSWYGNIKITYAGQFAILFSLFLIVALIIRAKAIVIFLIRLYQRYGPYDVRCMCVFIPNCSEYMILAIKKYGLIKGIKKGKDRLSRCHDPNGGEDYP